MLLELYNKKLKLKEKVEKELKKEEKEKALKNEHTYRKPIGCGFTVHVGYGCDNMCLYCYIQDMGLEFTNVRENELSGKQILYALLNNPYFVPEKTFLAFGSICDPFHPKLRRKTFEYLKELKILGNPVQFSTKFLITKEEIKILKECDKNMSCLVTIVTLKNKQILEPKAPDIEERIECLKNLKELKPAIFLRPIIPGINENEVEEIINLADSLKVSIVFGIFRATQKNLERLSKFFSIKEIKRRLPEKPKGKRQINVEMQDILKKCCKIAEKYNVRYFIRASCHNAWAHKTLNLALEYLKGGCIKCENNCIEKICNIDEKEIKEFLDFLNIKVKEIKVEKFKIKIKGKIPRWVKEWLQITGKKVFIIL